MRQNFLRLRRKQIGYAGVVGLIVVRIEVMNRDVRIGDRRLFEIVIDAAAAAS
jgi:hypothetical protein